MNKFTEDGSFDRQEWESIIDRWTFDEIDRQILKRKLLDNIPAEKIADEIGYSPRQTQRRLARAFDNLIKKI